MKKVFVVVIFMAVLAGGSYYGLPFLIEKETTGLRFEIHDLSQRLQKAEEFIKKEEEARKITQLLPDADAQKIIKGVNALSFRLTSLENSFNKGLSATDEELKRHKAATDESFKKQGELVDRIGRDAEQKIQRNSFNVAMATIRGHLLKVKVDLAQKNIGTAKNELAIIGDALEKSKASVSGEDRKVIGELQSTLKKAVAEIDSDLPSSTNLIDLIWHELSKGLRGN